MKKLIFTGNVKEDKAIGSLIKEVNNISCRMQVDIKNGFLTVEDVTDAEIDKVIDLVDNFYSTDSVEIDNVFEDTSAKQEIPIPVEERPAEILPVTKQESTPKTLEPQSEDDLIIKKVEFQNEHIEELTNKFLKTAYWAMYKMEVPEMDIGKFIFSVIDEISMRYTQKDTVEFVLGDIVDVNYGMHLQGEINGKHILAIVCKITPNNMAYLVPITKVTTDLTSNSYLTFNAHSDVTYYYDSYSDGTALLDKGRYLRIERINKVVGRTKPGFFIKLLNKLATTYNFTNVIPKDENIVEPTEKHNEESHNTNIASVSTSKTNSVNKVGKEEAALLELFKEAFDKLDATKSVNENIDVFFTDIGMPTNLKMVKESFIIACDIKKINFENIILELKKLHPNIKEEIIKSSLRTDFKGWLEMYPTLMEKFPKLSLMSLLSAFAKRVR